MRVYNAYKHIVQTLVLTIQGHYSCMYIIHIRHSTNTSACYTRLLFMHVYNAYKHIVQTLVLAIQGHYSCMYIMHIST